MAVKPRAGGPVPGGGLRVAGEPPAVALTIRVSAASRAAWRSAAHLAGLSLSEFMREAADNYAELVNARLG